MDYGHGLLFHGLITSILTSKFQILRRLSQKPNPKEYETQEEEKLESNDMSRRNEIHHNII